MLRVFAASIVLLVVAGIGAGDKPEKGDAPHWSLKPLTSPKIPNTTSTHPIDAFTRAKLAEKGLTPSPRADRRVLIRRLTYDLHGLPPTPAEVEGFVNDVS